LTKSKSHRDHQKIIARQKKTWNYKSCFKVKQKKKLV
jgi:hypothetical protein